MVRTLWRDHCVREPPFAGRADLYSVSGWGVENEARQICRLDVRRILAMVLWACLRGAEAWRAVGQEPGVKSLVPPFRFLNRCGRRSRRRVVGGPSPKAHAACGGTARGASGGKCFEQRLAPSGATLNRKQ